MLVALIYAMALWAQTEKIEVRAHVVDAKTGEALPYVNVYVGKGVGTITNAEGDFTLKVEAEASLRFSFVGYETLHIKVSELPARVRLTPMTSTLSEVEIIPWESILVKAGKKIDKEYKKHRREVSHYFYRMTTTHFSKNMAEAFVTARSAANLRNITFIKGRYGKLTEQGLTRPTIANMNFHHPLELGPMIADCPFWSGLRTPIPEIPSVHYLSIYYDIEVEELTGNKGSKIYKYHLKRKETKNQFAILTGTLYIDAKSLQVLKFEGQVENMYFDLFKDFYKKTSRIQINLTVNYNHDKGYTQVQSITYNMTNGDMSSQAILYNVDDMDLGIEEQKRKKTGENMLTSIDDAGFDRVLWNHSNIVQRTKEEEQLTGLKDRSMAVNDSIGTEPVTRTEKLVDHLQRFGRSLPQEKVYVHLDNTCYFLGDTIWFSAYTTQTNDSKPSQISGVLYVELYNQEGYLVERKILQMTNGRGYGNFILDPDAYAGYYELRAYTRWQLNWGLNYRKHSKESERWFLSEEMQRDYDRDYDKLYSRVFPVYDQPVEEGNYTEVITRRAMRRVYKRDPHQRKRQVTFYPEGGELVEGLPCRVAFEATWDDGQELEGSLNGAKAENRGRGTIEVTPKAKDKSDMVFTTKDGVEVKCRLPEAQKKGVALRVDVGHDSVDVTIRMTSDLQPDSLGLTLMHEGIIEAFIPVTDREQHIRLDKGALKVGVNQATVFDTDGRVWADRLFFVKDSTTTRSNVTVSKLKTDYQPYEQIRLTLATPAKGGGNMSLAVRDATHSDVLYDNASMLTEMLLTSEIKGFVPNPEFYFEKNDNAHNRALDLLMMTQGWRRFQWQDMAVKDAWQLTQVAEKTPVITGKVYKTPDSFYLDFWDTVNDDEKDETGENDEDEEDKGWDDLSNNNEETTIEGLGANHWQQNVNELITSNGSKTSKLSDLEYYPGNRHNKFWKKGMRVHAEMASPDNNYVAAIDIDTKDGYFKVQMPAFYGNCVLFLSADDTLKWKKGKEHHWLKQEIDQSMPPLKGPKYTLPDPWQVRVTFPYPRFVKPYNYYQTHLNYTYDPLLSPTVLSDGSLQIDEVNVWGKHNTLRSLTDSLPAVIIDAYDAYNLALDAGFDQSTQSIVRAFVGDYGLERPYALDANGQKTYRIKERIGYDITRRALNDITTNRDSAYLRRNLHSFPLYDNSPLGNGYTHGLTEAEVAKYFNRCCVDKYVIYTDYEPRLMGNERYMADDLPETQIAIYLYPDDSRRPFYINRRYIMSGFSYVNEFYHPNYATRRMDEQPKDYRRTLYWNPYLKLDEEGKASVIFYNNGSRHPISINAQGFGNDGTILSGSE